jgi:hypothetical protein
MADTMTSQNINFSSWNTCTRYVCISFHKYIRIWHYYFHNKFRSHEHNQMEVTQNASHVLEKLDKGDFHKRCSAALIFSHWFTIRLSFYYVIIQQPINRFTDYQKFFIENLHQTHTLLAFGIEISLIWISLFPLLRNLYKPEWDNWYFCVL